MQPLQPVPGHPHPAKDTHQRETRTSEKDFTEKRHAYWTTPHMTDLHRCSWVPNLNSSFREPKTAYSSSFCKARQVFSFVYTRAQQTGPAAIKTGLCKATRQSLTAQAREAERKNRTWFLLTTSARCNKVFKNTSITSMCNQKPSNEGLTQLCHLHPALVLPHDILHGLTYHVCTST